MSNLYRLRREFIRRFDLEAPDKPQRNLKTLSLWETMLGEEWSEFQQALTDYKAQDPDDQPALTHKMAELTAEGVDVLNVLVGLLLSQGLPLEAMTQAIHQANLRKCVDGKVIRRDDGKVLKPAGWQPADKEAVILRAIAAK